MAAEPTNIEEVLDSFVSKLNNLLVVNLGQPETFRPLEVISTGSLAIDLAIQAGGIPRGRFTEIYGPEGGGKSTAMYSCMMQVERHAGQSLFIDMEHKTVDEYAAKCLKALGRKPENVWLVAPPSGTDALDIAKAAVGHVDLIVIDSLPMLVTKAEVSSSDSDAQFMAMTARLLSTNLKQIGPKLGCDGRTSFVGINQVRDVMGARVPFYDTPCGRTWKHMVSLRLWIRKHGDQPKSGGINSKVTVKKSSIGEPDRDVDIEIRWGIGIDPYKDLVTVAPLVGVMERAGGYHYYCWDRKKKEPTGEGGFSINGAGNVQEHLRENPVLAELIRTEIETAIKEAKRKEKSDG